MLLKTTPERVGGGQVALRPVRK